MFLANILMQPEVNFKSDFPLSIRDILSALYSLFVSSLYFICILSPYDFCIFQLLKCRMVVTHTKEIFDPVFHLVKNNLHSRWHSRKFWRCDLEVFIMMWDLRPYLQGHNFRHLDSPATSFQSAFFFFLILNSCDTTITHIKVHIILLNTALTHPDSNRTEVCFQLPVPPLKKHAMSSHPVRTVSLQLEETEAQKGKITCVIQKISVRNWMHGPWILAKCGIFTWRKCCEISHIFNH